MRLVFKNLFIKASKVFGKIEFETHNKPIFQQNKKINWCIYKASEAREIAQKSVTRLIYETRDTFRRSLVN